MLLAWQISRSARPRGMTLVELLVVIMIVGMITAITIPVVQPALDTRAIREGARMVSSVLGSAQTRAITSGRPAGVWFDRLPAATGAAEASMVMFQAEVPLPWSGSTADATALVTSGQIVGLKYGNGSGTSRPDDNGWQNLISYGDLIQFNYQGPWYRIGSSPVGQSGLIPAANVPSTASPWTLSPVNQEPLPQAAPSFSSEVPYQIMRQPIRSYAPPVQMPGAAVVDLAWSGGGDSSLRADLGSGSTSKFLQNPVIVMFGPTGTLEGVYHSGGERVAADSGFYLLVGKREKLPAKDIVSSDPPDAQLAKHNWKDLENIWVGINFQTGLISTAEVAVVPDNATAANAVLQSRLFVRQAQSMGGR